ncbi:MAG: hypothetical protein ABIF77_20605 [bacterium]
MSEERNESTSYECVEPALGELLWQYDVPDVAPELRRQLDSHLSVCAACRLELALRDKLRTAVARDELQIPDGESPLRSTRKSALSRVAIRPLTYTAMVALAASVVLIFGGEPRALNGDRIVRGDVDSPRFLRPVAGEVIVDATPRLRWTPIPHATSYHVILSQAGGDFQWSTETTDTELTIPPESNLPGGARIRAAVQPVPAHLAPATGITVSFHTGGPTDFLVYRWRASPVIGRLLGWLGCLLCIGAGGLGLVKRRVKQAQAEQVG